MQFTFTDDQKISSRVIARHASALAKYRTRVQKVIQTMDTSVPEYSLAAVKDEKLLQSVYDVTTSFKKLKHVVVIGIGGSSLGTEAIHSVLATNESPELHVLDTVSTHEIEAVCSQLAKVKKAEHVAVCVISKSGGTTETLANAEVLIGNLLQQFGNKFAQQVVFIGNHQNSLLKIGKKIGVHTIAMPEVIGGRYSVFTPVGLVPLVLLGHDIEEILAGVEDSYSDRFEPVVAKGAAHLFSHLKKGYRDVNFFAFDTRLVRLGKWYRQLTAESLGKAKTRKKKSLTLGFVPTISTAVELHSIGQLYFSGFAGVYTDFVSLDPQVLSSDVELDAKPLLAKQLKKKTLNQIAAAIYGGVVAAYQERRLPFRATVFDPDESLTYSLGLFMGMRMLETMYVAELMDVNAFDQPNVEIYKDKMREILF